MEQDDQEGARNLDDDAFIDDSGVDPADRYGSDNEGVSAGDHPQVSYSFCLLAVYCMPPLLRHPFILFKRAPDLI